ncbi:erlin1 [Symbiodinium microadriaticum]|nr:erlin1 [Symbiodinium microadriaticum]
MEEQRVAEKRADTKKREATIEAQTAFDVALIEMQKQVANREAKAKMEKIEDDIHLHREHSRAEANFYHKMQESKANEWLLTDKYLHLKSIQAHANNAKVYFGEKIPTMLFEKGSEHIAGVASSDIHASEGNLSECVVNEETGSCTPN